MLLVDATTAEHTRGIRTVALGVLGELAAVCPSALVALGPTLDAPHELDLRRVALAATRPGRLLFQRLLLPLEIARLKGGDGLVDRVLLLDSYVPLLRPQRRVRYAAYVHDVLPLTHGRYWSSAKRAVKRRAFASLRRSGATVFTSSEHNARQIERLLGVRARVAPFGCGQLADAEADAAREAALPEHAGHLLYVGALEPRKDVLALIEAHELAVAGGLDVDLVIVGGGSREYVAAVEAKVAASLYRRRIRLVPRAEREQVLELVARAAALLFPTHAEGFGLPILEALALGAPVVASDLPEIRAWAGESILYAPPGRPEAWVGPIAAAVATDEARRREGQTLASRFRWRRCTEALVSF